LSAPDTPPAGGGQAAGAKERLQRISRHFLSEEDEIRRIAVLAGPDELHSLPLDGLARALAGLGRSVAVIDAAAGLVTLTRPDPVPQTAAGHEPSLHPERVMSGLFSAHRPDILLIRSPHPSAAITSCDLVLLDVPAQARGMRAAYLGLKALAQSPRIPPIGITLTGAPGRDEAAVAFGRFALAAQRFLDIRVTSYSYLAADAARGNGRSMTAALLEDIAHLLLEDVRKPDRHRQDSGESKAALGYY
jgi:hypothetical protein